MSLTLVILLIAVGLILIITEVFFIPGVNIAGIAGFLATSVGVYLTYKHYGASNGHLVLGGSVLMTAGLLYAGFRSGAWDKLANKDSLKDGRVNPDADASLTVGLRGLTQSSLRPEGRALFGDDVIQVISEEGYVATHVAVEIRRVEGNKVYVAPVEG